jgi:hypothetical protein
MLKGKQKKLDKNNNGRIDAEDFKLLQGSKKGMRIMGLQDESMKPGKVMKANTGGSTSVKSLIPMDHPDVKDMYKRLQKNRKDPKNKTKKVAQYFASGIRDMKTKKMTASEGSFKKGKIIKAKSGVKLLKLKVVME